MSDLKLSIAMCTYNGMPYLADQLRSFTEQTRLPDELVVCDDGSTDGTVAALEEFASTASFPVHVHVNERNLGVTKNFEKAVSLCTGDIIFLADQDDVWWENKLSDFTMYFDEARYSGVFSDAEIIDADSRIQPYTLWDSAKFTPRLQNLFIRGWEMRPLVEANYVTGATMAFRSKYRPLMLPVPDGWVHDHWFALILSAVGDLGLDEETTIEYRVHGKQQIGVVEPVAEQGMADQTGRARNLLNDKESAREVLRRHLREVLEKYETVRVLVSARLCDCGYTPKEGGYFQHLDKAAQHYRTRLEMPDSFIARIPVVLSELLKGNYTNYSTGNRAALRDLIG